MVHSAAYTESTHWDLALWDLQEPQAQIPHTFRSILGLIRPVSNATSMLLASRCQCGDRVPFEGLEVELGIKQCLTRGQGVEALTPRCACSIQEALLV
jgi:hypothetical protein